MDSIGSITDLDKLTVCATIDNLGPDYFPLTEERVEAGIPKEFRDRITLEFLGDRDVFPVPPERTKQVADVLGV